MRSGWSISILQSGADAFQTKSISLSRFVRRIGLIAGAELDEVAAAIAICVDAP